MDYKERKQALIDSFNDTLEICKRDAYLATSIKLTRANTKLIKDTAPERIVKDKDKKLRITVTEQKTLEAAADFNKRSDFSKIAILNFASAATPGGGAKTGSTTQEEYLCRCTTLYPCLTTDKLFNEYYLYHREKHSFLYSDRCIYTPGVVVIKDNETIPNHLLCDDIFTVNVITCAAPNLRAAGKEVLSDEKLFEVNLNRARTILATAASDNNQFLVLGAFGCGVFKNNPYIVARAFKQALSEYSDVFTEVRFAVYDTATDKPNLTAFQKVFSD